MDKLLVEAARKLHAEELFEIVRKNYVEANREYLQKQISIASEYLTDEQIKWLKETDTMSKLNSLETIEALENLVGSVYPSGDMLEDREREDNLCVLIDIVDWALDTIEDSAESRYAPCYYGHEIGERAYSALCKWKDRLVEHVEKNP